MMSEFEKQVRHALIDRDMTMTDLANELGITISYVSDLSLHQPFQYPQLIS